MVALILLVLIYLTFICFGLPSALLGSAWSVIRLDLNEDLNSIAIISVIVSIFTIISGLSSIKLEKKLSAGVICVIGIGLIGLSVIAISFIPSFIYLVILSIFLGLGYGLLDTSVNNYVAVHYKAIHMNLLHSFWAMGASIGPIIMSLFIKTDSNWRAGYRAIGLLEIIMVITLILTLPLWNKKKTNDMTVDQATEQNSASGLNIKTLAISISVFIFYVGAQYGVSLWGTSFLVEARKMQPESAAKILSFYFIGITVGRLVTGIISMKLKSKTIIRISMCLILIGTLLLFVPKYDVFMLISFVLLGFGSAPVFPTVIHDSPKRFGKQNSQKAISYQMSSSYVGSLVLAPLIGYIAKMTTGLIMFPVIVLIYTIIMLFGMYILYEKQF